MTTQSICEPHCGRAGATPPAALSSYQITLNAVHIQRSALPCLAASCRIDRDKYAEGYIAGKGTQTHRQAYDEATAWWPLCSEDAKLIAAL